VVENEEEGCFASKVAFSLDVTFDSREGEEERSRERVRKRAREERARASERESFNRNFRHTPTTCLPHSAR